MIMHKNRRMILVLPQNEQNSPKHENSQIPQAQGNVTVTIADVHIPPHHIDVQHGASSSSHDQGSIQEDDTMTEQNVANNTIVKKPHACNSGAAEAAAAGAEALPPPPSAGERSKTDVEQGKSQAKSSSPLKERLITFFTHGLSTKAKQVTKRLYRSPNKTHSKSKEGDESVKHPPQKIKHLRTRRRIRRTRRIMKKMKHLQETSVE